MGALTLRMTYLAFLTPDFPIGVGSLPIVLLKNFLLSTVLLPTVQHLRTFLDDT